jgi:hypothetical protein
VIKMTNNYAIIENQIVVNTAVAEPQYAQEQGWVELTGDAGIGWGYVDGQFVPPPPPNYSAQNKTTATSLLQQTDWTSIPAVADPLRSNPYLTNQGEFDTYRSQVREIAINPPTTPAVFPTQPQEIWSN